MLDAIRGLIDWIPLGLPAFLFVITVIVFIHELGHFMAMKYYHYADVKMFFIPLLGALVSGNKQKISRRQSAIITLAGPVPGIVLAMVLVVAGIKTGNTWMIRAANISIFINVFNLLPLTPLDGGRLIDTLYFTSREKLHSIFSVVSIIGLCCVAIYLETWMLLLIPLFMISDLAKQSKLKKIRTALDKEGVSYNKPYEKLSAAEYWQIRTQVISTFTAFKDIRPEVREFSSKEKLIITYVKSLYASEHIHDLTVFQKALFTATWIFFLVSPVVYYMLRIYFE